MLLKKKQKLKKN